jgi:hypothetical protein
MVGPAKDRMCNNSAGALNRARVRCILPQRNMGTRVIIQLNNITPTGPKSGKFCIAGIRGLVGGSSFTR